VTIRIGPSEVVSAFTGHRATTGSSRTNSIKNLNMIANALISFRIISKNSLQR